MYKRQVYNERAESVLCSFVCPEGKTVPEVCREIAYWLSGSGLSLIHIFAAEVYGCTVEEKKVHYKAGDSAPLGGLAYYKVLMRKGVKLFKGYFYPRVKAVLGNDNAATKADSITFGTNSTTFTVFRCNSDDWRITEELTTEAAAKAWVKEQLKGTVTPGG